MEPDKKSRYAGTPLVRYEHASGETFELRRLREIPRRGAVFAHVPIVTDRLDLLANLYYRDPLLFWRIADASPHMDPFDVVAPGDPVAIPPDK